MPAGSGDRWADDYERGRPGWPAEVVDVPGLSPRSAVLDLGAGTGKLTRLLAATFACVVAVEPAAAMRRRLSAACPDVDLLDGTAEAIPLADASVDAVFVAQAFHTFDDPRALAEIARVLSARGLLVLMWNLPGGPTEPSVDAAEEFLEALAPPAEELGYDPLDLGSHRYSSGAWQAAFAGSPFGALEGAHVAHTQVTDRDGLCAFYASMGWIGDLPDAERAALLAAVRSRLGADEYRRPWETHLYWTRLGDSP
jgi:SAM-dependent methyltransferase